MLIGTIEETGILLSAKGGSSGFRLVIGTGKILEDVKRGDNIAIGGACLTAASFDSGFFLADATSEILKHPNLGCLSIKSSLNLERATIASGRFGGHIVSGCIDGTGTIVNVVRDDNALWYTIRPAPSILRRIIGKESIAVDGVSLTVAQVREQDSSVSLILHTASHTALGTLKPDHVVNPENDYVGKYTERFTRISPSTHSTEGGDIKNRGTDNRITPELPKQYRFRAVTEQDH